jgi:hypothetical protein
VVREDILEQLGDRGTNTAKTVIHAARWWSVGKMNGGPSGGHLGVKKTLTIRWWYYWLHPRSDIEKSCWQCNTCTASRGLIYQNNAKVPCEKTATDIAGNLLDSERRNRYLLIAMSYFIKWLDVMLSPTTRHQQQWTNLFCRFGVPRETHNDQGNKTQKEL